MARVLVRYALFLSLVSSFLNAGVLSYEELKTKPKSLAKDYYIHRLITEGSASDSELKDLRKGVFRDRGKLKTALDKKIGTKPVYDRCRGVYAKNILDANLTCKLHRLAPKFASGLSVDTRNALAAELSNYPQKVNLLKGLNETNPAKYFADSGNVANFFSYYKSLGTKERASKFNFALDRGFASALGSDSYFKTFITDSVINQNHMALRKSLIDIDTTSFDSQAAFYLGINAIKFDRDEASVKFFTESGNKAKTKEERDRANLWIYLVTSSEDALFRAANSTDYNMYSLYAKELTMTDMNLNIVIPRPTKDSVSGYDETNPFDWVRLKARVAKTPKENLNALASKYDTKKTQGEYIYIKNIAEDYPDNFYPMPFMEYIGTNDVNRQALILAIARQESRFIQSAISISYALGMMQFMPFVANDWASKHDFGNFDQDDVFKPEVSYKMANIHLDWLERYLYNPVFIAYAYNGGIGFTKRMITERPIFKNGKYEPFLSMELVHYAESKEYAKKVLANYVVYSHILNPNSDASIIGLINDLTNPAKTDSYRK